MSKLSIAIFQISVFFETAKSLSFLGAPRTPCNLSSEWNLFLELPSPTLIFPCSCHVNRHTATPATRKYIQQSLIPIKFTMHANIRLYDWFAKDKVRPVVVPALIGPSTYVFSTTILCFKSSSNVRFIQGIVNKGGRSLKNCSFIWGSYCTYGEAPLKPWAFFV